MLNLKEDKDKLYGISSTSYSEFRLEKQLHQLIFLIIHIHRQSSQIRIHFRQRRFSNNSSSLPKTIAKKENTFLVIHPYPSSRKFIFKIFLRRQIQTKRGFLDSWFLSGFIFLVDFRRRVFEFPVIGTGPRRQNIRIKVRIFASLYDVSKMKWTGSGTSSRLRR